MKSMRSCMLICKADAMQILLISSKLQNTKGRISWKQYSKRKKEEKGRKGLGIALTQGFFKGSS